MENEKLLILKKIEKNYIKEKEKIKNEIYQIFKEECIKIFKKYRKLESFAWAQFANNSLDDEFVEDNIFLTHEEPVINDVDLEEINTEEKRLIPVADDICDFLGSFSEESLILIFGINLIVKIIRSKENGIEVVKERYVSFDFGENHSNIFMFEEEDDDEDEDEIDDYFEEDEED